MAEAVVESVGNGLLFGAGAGVNDADVVIQTNDVSRYDTFMLMSTGGAMQVLVSLDGTAYTTAPLSIDDMGATTTDPVIVTAANRMYRFRGSFKAIQVTQNGATAVAGATMLATKIGWW